MKGLGPFEFLLLGMKEQKEIKDAELEFFPSDPIESEDDLEKKRKREVLFEMALFFVLGILLGITIKTEAVKRITMGFNDYQIVAPAQKYDIASIEKDLKAQAEAAEQAAQQQAQQEQPESNQ